MRGPLVLASHVALAGLVGAIVACTTSPPPCYRGEYQGCPCAGGAFGYQVCKITEDGFEACVCDGTTPGLDGGRDASTEGAAEAAAPATGTFMTPCGPNGECTGVGARCHDFPSKGAICTKTCTLSTDCPPPSPGCTPNNGVCKAP